MFRSVFEALGFLALMPSTVAQNFLQPSDEICSSHNERHQSRRISQCRGAVGTKLTMQCLGVGHEPSVSVGGSGQAGVFTRYLMKCGAAATTATLTLALSRNSMSYRATSLRITSPWVKTSMLLASVPLWRLIKF